MQLLLSTFGGFEFMLTLVVFASVVGPVIYFLRNLNLKKKLDAAIKERDELRDEQYS